MDSGGHRPPVERFGWRERPWRRHPSTRVLGAWFDGEGAAEAGRHLAGCRRCQGHVHQWRRVRAALRGGVVPRPLLRPWWSRIGQAIPVGVLVAAVLLSVGPAPLPNAVRAARRYLPAPLGGSSSGVAQPAAGPEAPATSPDRARTSPPGLPTTARPLAPGAAPETATTMPSGPLTSRPPTGVTAPVPAPAGRAPAPLRLGAVIPGGDDADEIVRALRRAVDGANESGGVGGRPVELSTAPDHDPGAVEALGRTVDALVGGSGPVPASRPWLFPADPHAGGDGVVAGEARPDQVGARLAGDLDARGVPGPVGAVIGDGPDAALADGLATRRTVIRVPLARGAGCGDAVRALRRRAVAALALAGPPDLVERCTDAASLLAWRPPGGILVPPSAAYAHLERRPSAQGIRTVLGFPWPDGDDAGARRYRATVPGGHSYRALVSFAAVELAVQVARSAGSLQAEQVSAGDWRSDLFHLDHGLQPERPVVTASLGTWFPDPDAPPSGADRPAATPGPSRREPDRLGAG